MIETQESISTWVTTTFGQTGSNVLVAARANREMGELLSALACDDSHPKALEECADVVIVLMRLVHRLGGDLFAEVDRKMQINRTRKWTLRGDGTGDHAGGTHHEPAPAEVG